jgi:hypothetical protein
MSPCPEKASLLARYRINTAAYSYAVSELERNLLTGSKAGFDDLLRLTQATRGLANEARENFERHLSEHGC